MKEYFITKNNNKLGPFSIEELKEHGIDKNTLVWKHGMSDWRKANTLEELQIILENTPPPIPPKIQLPFIKYLIKNAIYIIISIVVGVIIGLYVKELSYDLIMDNYGEHGKYGHPNYSSNSNEAQNVSDSFAYLSMVIIWSIIPIRYFFIKKN